MSEEKPSAEGAGKIVLLVVAFLLMPPTIYLLARAGYTGGRMEVTMLFISPIFALAFWVAGMMLGCLQVMFGVLARMSVRFVVRRLALFTVIVTTVGSTGSCAGGCVWGHKVSTNEWPEPSLR